MTRLEIIPKSKLAQLFCQHSYVEAIKKEKFHALHGRTIYTVCEKCGRVRSSYFRRED